jgi:alpha-L-fucosidase
MIKKILTLTALSLSALFLNAQTIEPKPADPKMQWFSDAKLGIFIHWGIYSLGETSESWEFHNKHISHSDYMLQKEQFTASDYNPTDWVRLIHHAGARYAVITSKHHDGVALWNTELNDLSTREATPARKDVLAPFVRELRKNGIKTGLYFSLIDWSHPDYPGFLKDSSRYQVAGDPDRWSRYLKFCHGQVLELLDQYNPDLWWFDGDWEHSAKEWKASEIRSMILQANSLAILNGRLQGFGDYDTPEQNFPVTRPTLGNWELCMTTNDSWGYYIKDTNYKTPYEVISIFADVIGMGGNLLLDIGPKADGTIPEPQRHLLTELGNWTGKHSEAIFETLPGLPQGHFYGASTLSKDSTSIFLFLPGKQTGEIVVKGIMNKIRRVSVIGSENPLPWKIVGKISWSPVPGLLYLTMPAKITDPYMQVVKIDLEGPLKLYRGKGGLSL